ncbi:MAG: PIG-L deacetylase family protein [Gemmataceae bacterium]
MAERIMVIAPHPDDEAIGCGGMLCRHGDRGDDVRVVFLTSGEQALPLLPKSDVWRMREEEAKNAARVLNVQNLDFLHWPDGSVESSLDGGLDEFASLMRRHRPSTLYLPHPQDAHADHRAALPLVLQTLKRLSRSDWPRLKAFEIWSPLARADRLEDITGVMARKIRAVRCYTSQLTLVPYDRAIKGLNQYRGIMAAGKRYAEAFEELDPQALLEVAG